MEKTNYTYQIVVLGIVAALSVGCTVAPQQPKVVIPVADNGKKAQWKKATSSGKAPAGFKVEVLHSN